MTLNYLGDIQSFTVYHAHRYMVNSFSVCLILKEIEKKIKELQAGTEEMKKEIVQRQIEAKTLREDLEATQRQTTADKKDYEKLTDELEKLKVCFFFLDVLFF